jgi:hypothetical protein
MKLKKIVEAGSLITLVIMLIGLLVADTASNRYRPQKATDDTFTTSVARAAQADSLEEAYSFPNDTAQ